MCYLALAEFAVNNTHQSSLRTSPFFANYGYNPNVFVDARRSNISVPSAVAKAETMAPLHEKLQENLLYAQDQQAKYHDVNTKRVEFEVGSKVWLLSTNLRTVRPSKKLDWKC